MVYNTSNKRKSWEQRGQEGFSVGPALHNYRFIKAIDGKTKELNITDTAEYSHRYLTQPHITAEDRMTHAIHFFTASMAANCELQMLAGTSLSAVVKNCMACVIMSYDMICGCVRYL